MYELQHWLSETVGQAYFHEHTAGGCLKHIGIYLYRREFLLRYVGLPRTPYEASEALEQLRILEHGYPVDVVEATEDSLSVDTPADLAEVEALLRR